MAGAFGTRTASEVGPVQATRARPAYQAYMILYEHRTEGVPISENLLRWVQAFADQRAGKNPIMPLALNGYFAVVHSRTGLRRILRLDEHRGLQPIQNPSLGQQVFQPCPGWCALRLLRYAVPA